MLLKPIDVEFYASAQSTRFAIMLGWQIHLASNRYPNLKQTARRTMMNVKRALRVVPVTIGLSLAALSPCYAARIYNDTNAGIYVGAIRVGLVVGTRL